MSKVGSAAYESVLTRGNASPRAMESLVNVTLFGKGSDDSTTDSTTSSSTTTTTSSDEPEAKSRQLVGSPFDALARGEFVPPRYNPEVWAAAMEQSTRLGRSIRTYARNTVGLGWFIEPIHKPTPETPPEQRKRIEAQTKRLQELFERPNRQMPTSQLFFMMKVDEEATGDGYIEIVRDNAGRIAKIYHVPSVTMRIRVRKEKDDTQIIGGYVQIRGNEKRYFKEFGDTRVMDATNGEYYAGEKALPLEKRSTEILHFKLYSPTSTWYGAPRYVSAAPAVSGNRLASLRNVKFFENDAVPRMALLVSGGRLTPDSVQSIEDFFKAKVQGVDKAHSLVVIQTEQTKVGFQQNTENTRLELKPLTVGVTEDASFGQYRQANDDEIRESFGIAPVFYTTENVNKASAQVSREITNEQEFEPDRLEKEYIINQTIIHEILTDEKDVLVRFRFERMKLTDPLDTARMDQTYAGLGALTPNELRESMGKPPYPKEYKFADKPMQVAMAELSMQLAEAIIGEFKSQIQHTKDQARAQQEASGMGGLLGGAGMGAAPSPEQPSEEAPPEGQDVQEAPPEGGVGDSEDAEGKNEEWDREEGSTEESSPVSEDTTDDSDVKRIKSALGLSKEQIPVVLGLALDMMKEARALSSNTISNLRQEDR